jgi:YD repeat-containing protein
MSQRAEHGLKGSVKSCTEESTYPSCADAEGKVRPEIKSEHTMEYDPDGRLLATRYRNPDGTQWVTRFNYDAAGRLLKMGSGTDGQRVTTTTYSYDTQGRMETIRDDTKPETPVVFHYDGLGRKKDKDRDFQPSRLPR